MRNTPRKTERKTPHQPHSAGPVGPSNGATTPEHVMNRIPHPFAAIRDPMAIRNHADRMAWLCYQFPSLRRASGAEPWDACELHAWAIGPTGASGNRHAVRFVLSVWDYREVWTLGPFDVVAAFAAWDDEHRAACLTWLRCPWYP